MWEQSIGRLGKWREKRPRVKYKKGRRKLGKWEAVCDSNRGTGSGSGSGSGQQHVLGLFVLLSSLINTLMDTLTTWHYHLQPLQPLPTSCNLIARCYILGLVRLPFSFSFSFFLCPTTTWPSYPTITGLLYHLTPILSTNVLVLLLFSLLVYLTPFWLLPDSLWLPLTSFDSLWLLRVIVLSIKPLSHGSCPQCI